MPINYLGVYAYGLFQQGLGKEVEIKKKEKIDDRVLETSETVLRGIELSAFKHVKDSFYDIHIKIPNKEKEKERKKKEYDGSYINLTIKNISEYEMKALTESFKKIYKSTENEQA